MNKKGYIDLGFGILSAVATIINFIGMFVTKGTDRLLHCGLFVCCGFTALYFLNAYFDIKSKERIKLALNVASKTVGFDLSSVAPMPEKEAKKWMEDNNKWLKEIEHARLVRCNGNNNYIPTDEEILIIANMLGYDDNIDYLRQHTFTKTSDNTIIVSTPQSDWCCLAGREWVVNIENKTVRCTAMS